MQEQQQQIVKTVEVATATEQLRKTSFKFDERSLTTEEREEIESICSSLFGKSSAWQKAVKNGVVEPLRDVETGEQVKHKGIPVSRLIRKAELEVLAELRDLNQKVLADRKAKQEALEAKKAEAAALQKVSEAGGRVEAV